MCAVCVCLFWQLNLVINELLILFYYFYRFFLCAFELVKVDTIENVIVSNGHANGKSYI